MTTVVDGAGLPGQLALDLPGLDVPAGPRAPRRRPRRLAVGELPALPPRVWGVWDGEDLVGVYAEESVARADAQVLQRDAVRAGVRASRIDCLALPVLTVAQHARRGDR